MESLDLLEQQIKCNFIVESTQYFMISQKIQNGRLTLKIEFNIVSNVPSKEAMCNQDHLPSLSLDGDLEAVQPIQ